MKKIFIHFASNNHSSKLRESYLKKFLELLKKEKEIEVKIFYTGDKLDERYLKELKNKKIDYIFYISEDDAKEKITELQKIIPEFVRKN